MDETRERKNNNRETKKDTNLKKKTEKEKQ